MPVSDLHRRVAAVALGGRYKYWPGHGSSGSA